MQTLLSWLLLVFATVPAIWFAMEPLPRPVLPARDGPRLVDARSWGYQLQSVSLRSITTGLDVLVVDYSRDGSDARVFTAAEIDQLRTRADGSKRIILAYLSIGEAERYRYYWNSSWVPGSPSWLGPENPEWKGNYPVRFWEHGWQRLLLPVTEAQSSFVDRVVARLQPGAQPYLDRIIEAGFDGVYLDRVDIHEYWSAENKRAESQMIRLVLSISEYAKRRRPGFLVVPQNGEELLRHAGYRRVIDGFAKEDLIFGIRGDGQLNSSLDIQAAVAHLDRLKAEGRPVFVVEYLSDPGQRAEVIRQLSGRGFVVHFAQRDLRQTPE